MRKVVRLGNVEVLVEKIRTFEIFEMDSECVEVEKQKSVNLKNLKEQNLSF